MTNIKVQQKDVLQCFGPNITDIVHVQLVQELIEGSIGREKGRKVLVIVIKTMVKSGLFDCLAQVLIASTTRNFGYHFNIWKEMQDREGQ